MCSTGLEVRRPGDGEAQGPAGAVPGHGGHPLRILHLEDSPSDSDLAREHLLAEGIPCEVRRVETREQFERALDAELPDLILADFQLPAFDGVTAFLLAREICPEVPFIMVTGKLGEEYAIDTLELGVTDYVLKQRLQRLAPAVQRALLEVRERRARREAQEALRRHQERLEELVLQRTAELEERNGELAVANHDLELFVASATHDLRAPLVLIGGLARRLEKSCGARLAPAEQETLRGVVAAAERMERLLDDLLSFFRASKAAPARAILDMAAAVREAFLGLEPALQGRRVRLDVAPLPPAHGDPTLIRQVLANLLGNAVKYTGASEPALIQVTGWEEGGTTGYCVRDNGIGFDMAQSGRLFGLFQRLHDAPGFPGTGVGLAVVKRIVQRHGGKVWATGEAGRGATFCFTLPRPRALPSGDGGLTGAANGG